MVLPDPAPRTAAMLALLALVPVAAFVLGRASIAAVSLVNVVLIFGSLYVALSPVDDGAGHGQDNGSGHGSGTAH